VRDGTLTAKSLPAELVTELAYFDGRRDEGYVSGPLCSIHGPDDGDLCVRLRHSAPMFPPPVWNVHEETRRPDKQHVRKLEQ